MKVSLTPDLGFKERRKISKKILNDKRKLRKNKEL